MHLLHKIRVQQAEWLGHVFHISPDCLLNIAHFGFVPGKQYRGHPPKRWMMNILSSLSVSLETHKRHFILKSPGQGLYIYMPRVHPLDLFTPLCLPKWQCSVICIKPSFEVC